MPSAIRDSSESTRLSQMQDCSAPDRQRSLHSRYGQQGQKGRQGRQGQQGQYEKRSLTPGRWDLALLLMLAGCSDTSRYAGPRDSVPLTRIADTATADSLPFASIVPQARAPEALASPRDAVLNPEPLGLAFNPVPFLPANFGRVVEWSGRAGETEGMLVNPDTGILTGTPVASTTVFLRATNAAGERFDVVVPVTMRTILGDSSSNAPQTLSGTDDTAWLILGSTADDRLIGSNASDDIRGGDGNDILEGGASGDFLHGGAGRDRASYASSDAAVRVWLANDGSAQEASGGHAEGDQFAGIEALEGSPFDDVLYGNNSANRFIGGPGKDRFGIDLQPSGIAGADIILDFNSHVDKLFLVGLNAPQRVTYSFSIVLINGKQGMVIFSDDLGGNGNNNILAILPGVTSHFSNDFWEGTGHVVRMANAFNPIDGFNLDII